MAATTDAAAIPADRELVITRVLDAPRKPRLQGLDPARAHGALAGPEGLHRAVLQDGPASGRRVARPASARPKAPSTGCGASIARSSSPSAWSSPSPGRTDGEPGHETLVTVTFAEQGGKTLLTFHQAPFESVESRDSHHGGWSESFDRLEVYLASL